MNTPMSEKEVWNALERYYLDKIPGISAEVIKDKEAFDKHKKAIEPILDAIFKIQNIKIQIMRRRV